MIGRAEDQKSFLHAYHVAKSQLKHREDLYLVWKIIHDLWISFTLLYAVNRYRTPFIFRRWHVTWTCSLQGHDNEVQTVHIVLKPHPRQWAWFLECVNRCVEPYLCLHIHFYALISEFLYDSSFPMVRITTITSQNPRWRCDSRKMKYEWTKNPAILV